MSTGATVEFDELQRAYTAFNERDADTLVELVHPEIELHPLVASVTSTAPWLGHEGLRRLVDDTNRRWHRFELRCDDRMDFGERIVTFVRVSTQADAEAPLIDGDVAHLLELEDGLLRRFVAYRDRDDAIRAAELPRHG